MKINVEVPAQESGGEQEKPMEAWGENLKEELRQLRIKQYSARNAADFPPEERNRIVFLQKLEKEESEASVARGRLAERKRLEENLADLTPEEAGRLTKLQKQDNPKVKK